TTWVTSCINRSASRGAKIQTARARVRIHATEAWIHIKLVVIVSVSDPILDRLDVGPIIIPVLICATAVAIVTEDKPIIRGIICNQTTIIRGVEGCS
ncbi:MAG: hypothetical protein EBS01_10555, partial [Verrucomicrobia bacterium]|nr:hypothetical protein [Verrucomicrobiota bacterium]